MRPSRPHNGPPILIRVVVLTLIGFSLVMGWQMSGLRSESFGKRTGEPPWRDGVNQDPLPLIVWVSIAAIIAGVFVMRRWPWQGFAAAMAGMVFYAALGGFGLALVVPGVLALGELVRRFGLKESWPALVALPIVFWATSWNLPWLGLTSLTAWSNILTGMAWVLVPTLVMHLVSTRRTAVDQARQEELERVATAERLRMASEIHDVVGHSLSMISLQAGVALKVFDANPAQARASLETIRSSSKSALAEVRRTLAVFRGTDEASPLAPTPTLGGVASLVEQVRGTGTRVHLGGIPDTDDISPAAQTGAYRVVQEGLTNAIRHAPGQAVDVTIMRDATELVVRVTDDGSPTAEAVEGGGLRGMRERVSALGGRLSATATPNGFVVVAWIPVDGGDS
ncbi:MAG: sensor histidine kinase [Arachnia sp.]